MANEPEKKGIGSKLSGWLSGAAKSVGDAVDPKKAKEAMERAGKLASEKAQQAKEAAARVSEQANKVAQSASNLKDRAEKAAQNITGKKDESKNQEPKV